MKGGYTSGSAKLGKLGEYLGSGTCIGTKIGVTKLLENEFPKNFFPQNDFSKNHIPKNNFSKIIFPKNDFSNNDFSKMNFQKYDF